MEHLIKTLGLLLLILTVIGACKKDDPNEDLNDDKDQYDGYITFYTTTTGDNCGDIPVTLNGNSIGTLSGVTVSEPQCGAENAAGIITVGVPVGAHDYAASDNCNHIWTGTIIINRGDCKTKPLER